MFDTSRRSCDDVSHKKESGVKSNESYSSLQHDEAILVDEARETRRAARRHGWSIE